MELPETADDSPMSGTDSSDPEDLSADRLISRTVARLERMPQRLVKLPGRGPGRRNFAGRPQRRS